MSSHRILEESRKLYEREAERKSNEVLLNWVIINSDHSWSTPTVNELLRLDVHKAELYKRLKPWLEEK